MLRVLTHKKFSCRLATVGLGRKGLGQHFFVAGKGALWHWCQQIGEIPNLHRHHFAYLLKAPLAFRR